jgi:hypothetical protein
VEHKKGLTAKSDKIADNGDSLQIAEKMLLLL